MIYYYSVCTRICIKGPSPQFKIQATPILQICELSTEKHGRPVCRARGGSAPPPDFARLM